MELRQVALRATDLNRAVAFWAEILGQQPIATFDPPGLSFFWVGPVRLLLDRGAPDSLIYLAVDDVDDFAATLRAKQVAIETEPHTIFTDEDGLFGSAGEEERMAFFRDSEGNLVGISSRRPAQTADQTT